MLAGKLGLSVLGEGVETPEELEFIKRARCTCAQGDLFGNRMGFDDLVNWIDDWQYGLASYTEGIAVALV